MASKSLLSDKAILADMGCAFVETCKCWGKGTKLMMADGSTKAVEDIVRDSNTDIEQWLMGDDSVPRSVLKGTAHQGFGHMYRVTSANGSRDSWTCNADHVLVLKYHQEPIVKYQEGDNFPYHLHYAHLRNGVDRNSYVLEVGVERFQYAEEASTALSRWKTLEFECTVRDFISMRKSLQRQCIMYQPDLVNFTTTQAHLSLESVLKQTLGKDVTHYLVRQTAWVMGIWISTGSGSISGNGVCQFVCNSNHRSVIEELLSWCRNVYTEETVEQNASRKDTNISVVLGPVLHSLLQVYDMLNTRILPVNFLRESPEVRIRLLEGMIDGDALYSPNTGVYEIFVRDTSYIQLMRSLGFITGTTRTARFLDSEGGLIEVIRVPIGGSLASLKPILEHKRCFQKHTLDESFTIKQIDDDVFYGFTVSGNGRVLMRDFVITHNCHAKL